MLNLGKVISDYEEIEKIASLWEEPDRYKEIFDEDYFIISGRKGSGKSTIVDFRTLTVNENEKVIAIRPREDDDLYDKVREITDQSTMRYNDLRNSIAKLFELLSYIVSMRDLIEGKENSLLTGDLDTIYSFLSKHKLNQGSIIKRTLDKTSELTKEFKRLNKLFTLLDKIEGPTFHEAKKAFINHIKTNNLNYTVFIDDIDGYGFEYNQENKAFLDALVITAMKLNTHCVRKKINLRLVITPPTELFDNAKFWNKDKILTKTAFLRWTNVKKLQNLVNKRIAAEINIRKRKKRFSGDTWSIDPHKTWDKIFPSNISNRVGSLEPTMQYIIRHTFYTPRNVLKICQTTLEYMQEYGYKLGNVKTATANEWDTAIQSACEEQSNVISTNIIDIYETMYDGITDLLNLFEGRPNVWGTQNFRSFIDDECRNIVKPFEKEKYLNSNNLIRLLFQMGFIGFGFHTPVSPHGREHFDYTFGYLKWTDKKKWNMVIISPVFYDCLNIQPINDVTIVPHTQLKLSKGQFSRVSGYNYRTNSF